MRYRWIILTLAIMGPCATPLPVAAASATSSEARAVALSANCQPGAMTVLRQIAGENAETVYKVLCTGGPNKNSFVVVQCRVRQCVLWR
ncbi:MAG: hypothetical protein P4M00_20960 [Azospirillaceae bacterium]|nr:hypothetical protein [Azospirillaceae bacterium]